MSVFDSTETTPPVENPFEHLVGEGRKYSDPQALAKAKMEADAFIEQLKKEQAELRQQLGEKATIDEIMTQIKAINKPQENRPPEAPSIPDQAGLTPEQLEKIFTENYQKQKAQERLEANREKVERTLTEKFGSDASMKIAEKARELNVPTTYLQQIGLDSPEALFRMLGLNNVTATPSRSAPASRHSAPPPGSGERDQSYYERLKATNPTEYFTPKIQNQMMKDAIRLRDSFYN